jgi:hypothetical protein
MFGKTNEPPTGLLLGVYIWAFDLEGTMSLKDASHSNAPHPNDA